MTATIHAQDPAVLEGGRPPGHGWRLAALLAAAAIAWQASHGQLDMRMPRGPRLPTLRVVRVVRGGRDAAP